MDTTQHTAQKIANNYEYDIFERVASKSGWDYFLFNKKEFLGKKVGLPYVVKINSSTLETVEVELIDELMWAINEANRK